MDDTNFTEPRAKRQKTDKSGRSAAFEKLRNLKGKGTKHKYEVSDIDNVYETIDEKEYSKKVLQRQDDWIVDDDGSGYVEDGRDIFDDDLDSASIAAAKLQAKSGKKKRKAVSDNAGKGNLQFMLANMPNKKKEEVNLDEDDVLSEVLSEIDGPSTTTFQTKPKITSILEEKQAAQNYMSSFALPKPTVVTKKLIKRKNIQLEEKPKEILKDIQNVIDSQCTLEITDDDNSMIIDDGSEEKTIEEDNSQINIEVDSQTTQIIQDDKTQELFDDGMDMTQIIDLKIEDADSKKNDSIVTEEQLLDGWETMQEGVNNEAEIDVQIDNSQLPLIVNEEGKEVFRFFWWDAFEDYFKRPGVVYLFGKTYCDSAKTFVSCCVAVMNIERKIYLLPRTHHLDNDKKPTDKPVALIDVYHEFNDVIAENLQLKVFKSKKVTKNYAFNPQIPTQSEYLEVRYSAKNGQLESNLEGKTFSKVFGTHSNFLEILLLECKIKGPCWIDIENPNLITNPVSRCKFEVSCMKPGYLKVSNLSKPLPPPPLVVATINMRTAINPKTTSNEIVMLSCLTHSNYCVDKQSPNPPFERHFCVFTKPGDQIFPLDLYEALRDFKGTRVQKMDSERALLNYFVSQFTKIDPDLIVGHDLESYQIGVLHNRLLICSSGNLNAMSKIKRSNPSKKGKFLNEIFTGRLICDIKISSKELIKSRSFDLDTLCQTVLKLKEGQRIELESQDIPKMYQTSQDLLKLISFTMQDTAYILKIMYELNVIPLALQITNIAGNVMSKTLMGGRSERNEFLLLHAFYEKDYIVPDKIFKKVETDENKQPTGSKKKPTYSGGLVLDPKVGFYDKLVLLMDFNSLYPSIIQEYNICFTTINDTDGENIVLPDKNLPPGILPTEIRKLVESRREVKKLMTSDITNDLRMQYNIRQMALKLTANSMYGCLGFTNSRFYAKTLAALVTQKGREILMNTKDLVQKMSFEVIYGDTDSIMIKTDKIDYDQVIKIGYKIKQEINRLYRQVELDIDGVFKYLLLLKKKKYAAVTLTKTKTGELKTEQEHKGLDIVRRDWSQLAAAAGKFILNHILSEQSSDDRINNIHAHLVKLKDDLEQNLVPLSLLVITKQLSREPHLYSDKNSLPHVQVALRYNKKGGKPLRAGDTVPYVICEDGSGLPATQRGYHIDELKNSTTLKVDVKYYLSQQIYPVVTRLCEPIEGTDSYQIANCLGVDTKGIKKANVKVESIGENIRKAEVKFKNVKPFTFKCFACKTENIVNGIFNGSVPVLEKCSNTECNVRPVEYIPSIQNQLTLAMRAYIKKYYLSELTCEDPACPNDTTRLPLRFAGKYPVCNFCQKGVMYKKYSEGDLYTQLSYFQYIFDLSKAEKIVILERQVEIAYQELKETVEKILNHSGYSIISLSELFSGFLVRDKLNRNTEIEFYPDNYEEDDDEDF